MALAIQRRFTRAGESPYAAIEFRLASSEIRSPDGSIVFRLDQLEAPASWSQVAIDVLAQKYFRKAGVARRLPLADRLLHVLHRGGRHVVGLVGPRILVHAAGQARAEEDREQFGIGQHAGAAAEQLLAGAFGAGPVTDAHGASVTARSRRLHRCRGALGVSWRSCQA